MRHLTVEIIPGAGIPPSIPYQGIGCPSENVLANNQSHGNGWELFFERRFLRPGECAIKSAQSSIFLKQGQPPQLNYWIVIDLIGAASDHVVDRSFFLEYSFQEFIDASQFPSYNDK